MTFGERFKQLREDLSEKHDLKKSQRGFAATINIIGPTISNIESGGYIVGGEILIRLKEAYPEVNLNWLLVGEGNMYVNPSDNYQPSMVLESEIQYQKMTPQYHNELLHKTVELLQIDMHAVKNRLTALEK